MSGKTIVVIEQVNDKCATQGLELRQSANVMWLRLISRWGWHGGPKDRSITYLRPEDLIELADALKDHLDDEAGKGEDPPCEEHDSPEG